MDLRHPDRRIAPRTATERRIQLLVPGRDGAADATIENVSVTGVIIRSHVLHGVDLGDLVAFVCDGHEGQVIVNRIEPTDEEGVSCYAGELIEPSDALLEELLGADALAARRQLDRILRRAG